MHAIKVTQANTTFFPWGVKLILKDNHNCPFLIALEAGGIRTFVCLKGSLEAPAFSLLIYKKFICSHHFLTFDSKSLPSPIKEP